MSLLKKLITCKITKIIDLSMLVLHLFYYLHNLLYVSRFKRFTIDLRQEARDGYRVRKAASRASIAHVSFPSLIAGREIKVKVQRFRFHAPKN